MKKIVISSKCSACGTCSMNTKYIKENPDGTASPEGSGILSSNDMDIFQKIIDDCPSQAISLQNAGIVKSTGKEGLRELKGLILSEYNSFKAPMPARDTYDFVRSEFSISIPYSSNERRYEYKSSSRAEDAGRSEFDRIMYSQRKPLIQQIIVQYKNRKLSQFFEYKKQPGNYYYNIISTFETRFDEYVVEAKELSGNKIKLPDNFTAHNIEPSFTYNNSTRELDRHFYQLENLEKLTGVSDLIAGEISSLSSYYIDSDDRDVYEGNKEKTYWGFNLTDVKNELARDILSETDNLLNNGTVKNILQVGLDNVMKMVNEEINKRVQTLLQAIESL